MADRQKLSLRTLVFCALMLAVSIVLKQMILFRMPQGGYVTPGSMLPLLLISYRYGTKAGVLAGLCYGLLDMLLDPFFLHPVQIALDYFLAFSIMAVAGLFKDNWYLGAVMAFVGRFLCHFISGVAFFGSYAPAGTSPVLYSLLFNGTYLVPECLICLLLIRILPMKRLLSQMR